jgi:hypothetical protein
MAAVVVGLPQQDKIVHQLFLTQAHLLLPQMLLDMHQVKPLQVFHRAVEAVILQQQELKQVFHQRVDLLRVALVLVEHQVLAQAVLAVLAIFMLAVLAQQAQEHLLVAAVVAQDLLLLALTHLPTMAATAAQVVAVEAVLPH